MRASSFLLLSAAVVVLLAALWVTLRLDEPAPVPQPTPQPRPEPQPVKPNRPKPCPGPGPCPQGTIIPFGQLTLGGPTAPDGKTQVMCDLPVSLRKKNTGGTDGAGLCVWTSIGHSAAYQNERALVDMQKFAARFTGGGWPQRVDEYIPKLAREQGVPTPEYLQYEGKDPAILLTALASGRMPAVTYCGRDPHYGSQNVAHMVNLVYLDSGTASVLDNNYPEDGALVWMSAQDFLERWTWGGSGWAVVLLSPAPPPVPH